MGRKRTSRVWSFSDVAFKALIAQSKSASDALRKIELRAAGNNYRTLKMRITELGLNTDHWKTHARKRLDNFRCTPIPLEEVLVRNSTYRRKNLKRRIIQENLIPYECAICAQLPVWKGKPMVLILDHINGVANDHQLENLRFLCPNCNSQQDTFCGKNKKKKINFCQCGAEIYRRSEKCRSCAAKFSARYATDWPPVEELKQKVASSSYEAVGRELGVTGTSVKKRIRTRS